MEEGLSQLLFVVYRAGTLCCWYWRMSHILWCGLVCFELKTSKASQIRVSKISSLCQYEGNEVCSTFKKFHRLFAGRWESCRVIEESGGSSLRLRLQQVYGNQVGLNIPGIHSGMLLFSKICLPIM